MKRLRILPIALSILTVCPAITDAGPLKLHAIFTDHMVLQRDKPIRIWGWADDGDKISVQFGNEEVEATARGDEFIVTFDNRVLPDDKDSVLRGFSIAGEDGKFYLAHARHAAHDGPWWEGSKIIRVWSPLVEEPIAIRYAWARAPMGSLKANGHPDRPFPSFRTDTWDFPESEDPEVSAVGRGEGKAMKAGAEERLAYRRAEEAKRGVELLEGIKKLGRE